MKKNLHELIKKWQDKNKAWHYEDSFGVKNFRQRFMNIGFPGPLIYTLKGDFMSNAVCPKCGGQDVVAKVDAFVVHPVPADGKINWEDLSDVETYDYTIYECRSCHSNLTEKEIEEANGFTLKGCTI